MNTINWSELTYSVCGLPGFTLTEALQLWKTKYPTVQQCISDMPGHAGLYTFKGYVREVWDEIRPITVQEAFKQPNLEKRRVIFECISPAELFQALQPELLDRQVIHKKRTRWDAQNQPREVCYDDTYELYRIEGRQLFPDDVNFRIATAVYAVRCWCTTTAREYWIYVPTEAAMGTGQWSLLRGEPDAIRAIAWTIQIDISFPGKIYRQGDIILVEETAASQSVTPYHLSKEQYLELVFSET